MALTYTTLTASGSPMVSLGADDDLGPPQVLSQVLGCSGRLVSVRVQQLPTDEGASVLVRDLVIGGSGDLLGEPTDILLEKWHDVGSEFSPADQDVRVSTGQLASVGVRSRGGRIVTAVTLVVDQD